LPEKCSGEVCWGIAILSFVVSIASGFLGMLAAVVGAVRKEQPSGVSLVGLAANVLPFGFLLFKFCGTERKTGSERNKTGPYMTLYGRSDSFGMFGQTERGSR
jgi:hypothetical protein